MRILAISDFHGAQEVLDPLLAACREESPAAILFAGDVVRGFARGDEWLAAQPQIISKHLEDWAKKQSVTHKGSKY